MPKMIYLNVTTEDGELLERIEVELSDDRERPVGTAYGKAWIMSEIEAAARIVFAREEA